VSRWGRLIFHVTDVDAFWTHLKEKGFDPEIPRDASRGERYFHMLVAACRRCNRPLHEPVIVPASVVEVLCAFALGWGAAAVLKQSRKAWRAAFIGNLVAIIGVAIGMVALAEGAGPRTASNDLYHGIMLALATASLVILLVPAGRTELRRN
jgi:hypothetical protein